MAEPVDLTSSPADPAAGRPLLIGLGASAGGVTALRSFFAAVEPQGATAYVVILHLSPDHDSRLAEVLQLAAPIPVTKLTGTTAIVPDHVYVAAPNKQVGIVDGRLTVEEFTDREQRLAPVDAFFRTLADSHGSRAACVILSGTGPNGSAGLRRIKEQGGLAVAQDPAEAEYADMPRNAIATGLIDVVSPVADIPRLIREHFDGIRRRDELAPAGRVGSQPDGLPEVLTLLRQRTGHDFSNYKAATVQRRIERRMTLRAIDDLPAYVRLLQQDGQEAISLMKELLISVTNFFRDPPAWLALETRVIPRLFLNKRAEDQVRVWVPGCATGEEAYSVAMLLAEYASTMTDPPAVQLFATDLDQVAIDRAREGIYADSEIADVPEDRLQRFFHRETRGYRISRALRELVLFATHNVIKDPPFSHLDLISCRNVLIYLNRPAQEKLIDTFHFSLRPGGYLFLGGSEAPDDPNDLFLRFDPDAHIYESRTVTSRIAPRSDMTAPGPQIYQPARVDPRPPDRILPVDLHQRLLEQYAPPSLVVNEELHVVHMSDRVGRYLRIRGGEPTSDLMLLARPEVRTSLRGALQQAGRDQVAVQVRGLNVTLDDGPRQIDIVVKPVLRDRDPAPGFFLVLFQERSDSADLPPDGATPIRPVEPGAQQLEDELARINGQLRSTIDQYETQAEEAKASNEELQAMNEELRSAAEELETSKEELQSVNEELTTLNQELKTKIEELGHVNNDFHNFITATDIGTIFLDHRLLVKFSTPRAREVFNLLESDIGRPLSDITSRLRDVAIHQDVRAVLERLVNVEREVQTEDGRWHLMRILPYRTSDNRIDGVVITFQDVTEGRSVALRERQSDERLRLLIDSALEYAMFTISEHGAIDSWNPGAQRMFGYTPEEIVGADVGVLFTPEDRAGGAHLREQEEAARTGRAIDERYHVRKDGSQIYCSGVMRRLGSAGTGFAKIARDLTSERAAADALQRAHDELESRVDRRTAELASEVREHHTAKVAVTNLLHRLVTSQEDERRRISRDLHDDMGQRLTALRLMLERAQRAIPSERRAEISDALRMTAELGGDLDFLSWQLRPAVLDELGLAAALPRFVAEWSAHVGIPAEFRFGGYQRGQLSADAEVVFYRVAQEALNNVAKHAQASRVDVVLGASDGQVNLVVEDDGIGFEMTNEIGTASGFGLLGMRERAALSGGILQVESSPGRGTAVFLRRPAEPVGAESTPS